MSTAHAELPTADLAPTGRAKCIQCTQAIAKGSVRIAVLRSIDTGSFVTEGPGYLHPACASAWAEANWEAGFSDLVEQVQRHSALPSLPPPFSEGEPGSPSAKVEVKAEPALPAPPFGPLGSKQVEALASKLKTVKEEHKADSALEKAGIDWSQRESLRWHLARHGLVPPTHVSILRSLGDSAYDKDAETIFSVLPQLGIPTPQAINFLPGWSRSADLIVLRAMELDPDRLAALLDTASPHLRRGIQLVRGRCGVPLSEEERSAILDGLAACEAKSYGLPRVYTSQGDKVCANGQGDNGITPDCYLTAFDFAKHFGSFSDWQQALAKHAAKAQFSTVERVHDGLVVMSLSDLIETLRKPHFSSDDSHYKQMCALLEARGDDPQQLAQAAQKIAPDDHPGAYIREILLLFAMGQMGARKQEIPDGLALAPKWEQFAYCVAPWRGSSTLRRLYQRALAALPKQQVFDIITTNFLRDYAHNYAFALLSVAYSDELTQRILFAVQDPNFIDASAVAPLGEAVLPILAAYRVKVQKVGRLPSQQPADYEKGLRNIARCVRAVLGYVGSCGKSFDAELDSELSIGQDEDYWQEEERTTFLHMLQAMPEQRRIAALRRLLQAPKYVERAFLGVHVASDEAFRKEAAAWLVKRYGEVRDHGLLQRAITALGPSGLASFREALLVEKPDPKLFDKLADVFGRAAVLAIQQQANVKSEHPLDRLFRLCAQVTLPKQRVYLLEHAQTDDDDEDDDKPTTSRSVPSGSFSVSRGKGPTLAESAKESTDKADSLAAVARKGKRKRRDVSEQEHILTLDLKEIPELAADYPGMRALSLFARDPNHGDGWDDARLVPVPEGSSPPSDGSPVAVLPLDVPFDVFLYDVAEKEPILSEIRSLLFNRPGYVLGEPMFIQGEEEADGSGAFLFQLSESMGDLNLGDSGSLYVFSGGCFMQCY